MVFASRTSSRLARARWFGVTVFKDVYLHLMFWTKQAFKGDRNHTDKQLNLSMTRESLVIRNHGYRRHGSNHKKSRPCFFTKSVRFGRTELLFFFPCSKSRDLQSEHGFRACSFKRIRNKLKFHCDQKAEKKRKSGTKSVECWSPEL